MSSESSPPAEDASESADNLAEKKKQKFARMGMSFLLQQIRSSSSSGPAQQSDSSSAPTPEKKAKLDPLAEVNEESLPQTAVSEINTERREDVQLPTESEFYAKIVPLQVVSDAFCEGTAPDFGAHIRRFIGENNYVRSCKWYTNNGSPDGNWLASESLDRIVRVFQFQNEELLLRRKVNFGGLVYDLRWSPAAVGSSSVPHFVSTSRGTPIHCWSTEGRLLSSFRGINDKDELESANTVAFSLDGRQLFAGYRNWIRLFDFDRPGRQVGELKTFQKGSLTASQKGLISAIAMCPSFEGVYAAATYAGSVGLYSTQTRSCDCLISGGADGAAITHLQYSPPDANLLFAGLRKSQFIRCYDLRMPGRILHNYRRQAATNQRFYFEVDPHGHYLYTGSSTGDLHIFDLKRGDETPAKDGTEIEPNHSIKCSAAAVTGLSLHPRQQLVALSTGQRVFPDVGARLFPEIASAPPADGTKKVVDPAVTKVQGCDESGYTEWGKGSPLDNSIKLYKFAQMSRVE